MASCPKCYGKLKKKAQKVKGGQSVYRCESCHRKYTLDYETGRLVEKTA